jgi:hypothetical protein
MVQGRCLEVERDEEGFRDWKMPPYVMGRKTRYTLY